MGSTKKKLVNFWNTSKDYFIFARQKNVKLTDERREMLRYITKGSLVLDIACGTAENGKHISKIGKYAGCDISSIALKMAKDYSNSNLFLIKSDVNLLPFPDNLFDHIISTYSIEHFTYPEKVLNEMYRVCKKNGKITVISPAWDLPYSPPPSLSSKVQNRLYRYRYDAFRFKEEIKEIITDLVGWYRFKPLLIENPEVFENEYEADNDTVYIVRIREIKRFFCNKGCKIIYLKKRLNVLFPYWGINLFIVVEKR